MVRIVFLDEWCNKNLHANWFPTAPNTVLLKVDIYAYIGGGGGGVTPPPGKLYLLTFHSKITENRPWTPPSPENKIIPRTQPHPYLDPNSITNYLLFVIPSIFNIFFLDLFILGRNHYIYKNKVMKIKWYLKSLCPFKEAEWSTNQINHQIFLKF